MKTQKSLFILATLLCSTNLTACGDNFSSSFKDFEDLCVFSGGKTVKDKDGVCECDKECAKGIVCIAGKCANEVEIIKCNEAQEAYCEDGYMYSCKNGFSTKVKCENGCLDNNNECRDCNDGDTKCEDDGIKKCVNGKWSESDNSCNGLGCRLNGTECAVCRSGDMRCIDESDKPILQYCFDGIYQEAFSCPIGCSDDKSKCAECSEKMILCTDVNKYKKCNNGSWSDEMFGCPNSEVCTSQGCGRCSDGNELCIDGALYKCNDGNWVDGTKCEYGCKDNNSCAECDSQGQKRCEENAGIGMVVSCINGVKKEDSCAQFSCNSDKNDCGKCLNNTFECSKKDGVWSYKECRDGMLKEEKQCEENQTCDPNRGCISDGNDGKCNDGSYRCSGDGIIQICNNGSWENPKQNEKIVCGDNGCKCNDGYTCNSVNGCYKKNDDKCEDGSDKCNGECCGIAESCNSTNKECECDNTLCQGSCQEVKNKLTCTCRYNRNGGSGYAPPGVYHNGRDSVTCQKNGEWDNLDFIDSNICEFDDDMFNCESKSTCPSNKSTCGIYCCEHGCSNSNSDVCRCQDEISEEYYNPGDEKCNDNSNHSKCADDGTWNSGVACSSPMPVCVPNGNLIECKYECDTNAAYMCRDGNVYECFHKAGRHYGELAFNNDALNAFVSVPAPEIGKMCIAGGSGSVCHGNIRYEAKSTSSGTHTDGPVNWINSDKACDCKEDNNNKGALCYEDKKYKYCDGQKYVTSSGINEDSEDLNVIVENCFNFDNAQITYCGSSCDNIYGQTCRNEDGSKKKSCMIFNYYNTNGDAPIKQCP